MSARPDLLADLPQVMADTIRVWLPELKSAEVYHGRFNLADLRRTGVQAPGVRVSVLGARPGETFAGGVIEHRLQMAAYVVTRDRAGLPRDKSALSICQQLLAAIPERRWGEEDCGPAIEVTMQSLVTAAVQDVGASLWAVTWRQPVTLTSAELRAPMPVELYLGG